MSSGVLLCTSGGPYDTTTTTSIRSMWRRRGIQGLGDGVEHRGVPNPRSRSGVSDPEVERSRALDTPRANPCVVVLPSTRAQGDGVEHYGTK